MSVKNFSCFLLIILFLLPSCAGKFEAPPIYYEKENLREGSTSKNFLGPFITYTDNEDVQDFGVRPLFFLHNEKSQNVDEKEFLYPLLVHKSENDYTRTKALLSIISLNTKNRESGFVDKDFRFFPFIFYRDYEEDDLDHFAFFPFYGNLKNFLGKDEIDFILFPIYLSSSKEGEDTESYLWPVFSKYSGNHTGGRVWPLYGKRTRESDSLDEEFILWPFYFTKSREFYGEQQYQYSFFPFYSESDVLGIKNRSYLGPFISFTENEKRGIKRWDIPWPLVNVSKGEVEQTRVFPFYSSSTNEKLNDRDGFVLWPVYDYKESTLYDHAVHRKSVLIALYKDIEKVSLEDDESIEKRVHMWPFFSYERDEDGFTNIHALTLFEPFVRSNERLYRNYSSFWRLYEKQKSPDGEEFTSVLWNIYSSRKTENAHSVEFKPLLPVFTYKKVGESKKFNLLGGFLGFENKEDRNYIKLLYFSIPVGDGEGDGDTTRTKISNGEDVN